MKPNFRILLCLSLSAFVVACSHLAIEEPPRIVDLGIYTDDRENPELLKATDQIPATVGTVFGLRLVFDDENPASLSFRWTFPTMQNPDSGQIWTEMQGTREYSSGQTLPFLARINNDWEAIPGEWVLQVLRNEHVIIEKVFLVVALPETSE